MIRDTRTYVAINVVGALAALFLLAFWAISPPSHPLFPVWLLIGLAAFSLGGFVFQIIMRLTGRPVPLAPWAHNMTDRQLWIMKSILIAALVVITCVVIFVRVHQP
jgi:hypothetical protein